MTLVLASVVLVPVAAGGPPPPAPEDADADAPDDSGSDGESESPAMPDPDDGSGATLPAVDTAPSVELPAEEQIPPMELEAPAAYTARMESAMADMSDLVADGDRDDDLVRVSCIQDKYGRAQAVLKLGTTELMITRDQEATEMARHFAHQKLAVAAERLEELVEEARGCSADILEELANDSKTDAEEVQNLPMNDPSTGLGGSPDPAPPVNGMLPPVASPTS